MQTLRRAHFLARFVLVWFALALGVAIASPIVKPQAMELVCSAGGSVKLMVTGDDGAAQPTAHTLDCPLCMINSAPPSALQVLAEPQQPLGHALRPISAAHIAGRTAAPLPARGPPAFL
jgi:hypothetical protein